MQFLHVDIFSVINMHDIRLQMHLCGNHPIPEVRRIRHHACHLLKHAPVHYMDKYVYVLPNVMFHIYQNCMFPGIRSHNLHHIRVNMHIRLN